MMLYNDQDMKKPRVSVVIPSWNSESQLKKNLRYACAAASEVGAEIIVVDDASSKDDSVQYLKSQGDKIRLYQNKSNLGFSATVNRGVKLAKGDYVVLLNTDVRPKKDCFKNALPYFIDSSIYAVTFNSGEGYMGADWSRGLLEHYRIDPKLGSETQVHRSAWASGGQAIFDRKKWLQIGGMDLLYKPFYWEDVDMGYTAWKRGWQVLWAPDCQCVHDHETSVISGNHKQEYIRRIAMRNQFLFVWKNISSPSLILAHLMHLPKYLLIYSASLFQAIILFPKALSSRRMQSTSWIYSDNKVLTLWKNQK